MGALVTYRLAGSVATITMDDGRLNVLSPRMFEELSAALDRARGDGAVVLLSGREGALSSGFDLKVLRGGGSAAVDLLHTGFSLAERLLSFPTPVVIACPGHAVAMGVFLLLSADYRVGSAGDYKITANEVAIGMTLPRAGIEICRQRLSPAHFQRAMLLSEVYTPEAAVAAGFLDRVVAPADLTAVANAVAEAASKLDLAAHAASKLRLREHALAALRAAIEADQREFRTRL